MVNFEISRTKDGSVVSSDGGEEHMLHRWWKSLSSWNIRWGCFVIFVFALILSYIKKNLVIELEVNYHWDKDKVANILLYGLLGFLLACPVIGTMGDILGSLNVMMI